MPVVIAKSILLRSGDKIYVSLPGEKELNKNFEINRQGWIILPEVGTIHLTGKSFPEARKMVKIALSKYFVNLGHLKIKLIRSPYVNIVGAVSSPGRYAVGKNTTLLDLLADVKGLDKDADLTEVKILRKGNRGKSITYDMEQFFEKGGDFRQLPSIHSGDTIYIPRLETTNANNKSSWLKLPTENSIYIFGHVGRPGRYKFKPSLNFLDILSAADGPTNGADLHNIRVIEQHYARPIVYRVNLSLYFETGDQHLLPVVKPGDSIFVPSLTRDWIDISKESTVRVLGAVGRAGRYPFTNNMTILDLLAVAGGPTDASYLRKIVVINISNGHSSAHSFDLIKFAKTGDIGLLPVVRPGDTIFVPYIHHSTGAIIFRFFAGIAAALVILRVTDVIGGTGNNR